MEQKRRILLADYPLLPLDEEVVEKLHGDALDWAHANGLVMRTREARDRSDVCMTAPFALLPSPFPRELFQHAVKVQNDIARLYLQLAHERDFLMKCHAQVIKTDDFTRKMVEIYEKVMDEGLVQPFTLAIQRSDYMAHKDSFGSELSLKQIEVNNIASSMGGHAERVTRLHRRHLAELGYQLDEISSACPDNEPISMIGEALHKAWTIYGKKDACILVVVENVNQNQIDQRLVEYDLEKRGIGSRLVHRQTLTQCYESLTLDSEKRLLYKNNTEVAVIYFRSGYSPEHYPTDREWDARLMMERSQAIRTPWIGLQLANTKKVQQVLAEDGVVERFSASPRIAASLRSTFAGLWPLNSNDPSIKKIVTLAEKNPHCFVLKPQLEGGAGNYYGDEIAEKLRSLSIEEKDAHILMERLSPDVVKNYLIRANQPVLLADVVGELGIYGYAYGVHGDREIIARTGGHILRSKGKDVNEGGVAVGAAVIDSPFLYDLISNVDRPQ
ncbi:unnamed protein product, partial [Mesorhabditis belari]|uniref:Glutathione synthetase n=1 Tax=Mesorhabditis belari TaxID=2138241 RepID=A0AAF3J471_9BILA